MTCESAASPADRACSASRVPVDGLCDSALMEGFILLPVCVYPKPAFRSTFPGGNCSPGHAHKKAVADCQTPWFGSESPMLRCAGRRKDRVNHPAGQPDRRSADAGQQMNAMHSGSRSWLRTAWNASSWRPPCIAYASIDDYDALLLPGGTVNPDKLCIDETAVSFVRDFVGSGTPVATICSQPLDAGGGRRGQGPDTALYPSVRTDLCNAGATIVDEEVIT